MLNARTVETRSLVSLGKTPYKLTSLRFGWNILLYEAEMPGLDDVTGWIMRVLECFEVLGPEELSFIGKVEYVTSSADTV